MEGREKAVVPESVAVMREDIFMRSPNCVIEGGGGGEGMRRRSTIKWKETLWLNIIFISFI